MEEIQNIRREIFTFLIITFVLSTPLYFLIGLHGVSDDTALYTLGVMWCPGVAAFITRFVYHRSLRGMGWGWGKTRYQLLAYFLPGVYNLVLYGFVWLSGLGGISDEPILTAPVIVNLVFGALVGPLLGSWTSALGEEIGWRGLLVPQMVKLTSFTKTSLITGVIWAVWHYPLVIFSNYRSVAGSESGGEIPLWYALICFSITVIGMSFIFNWVRLKSGSVWTAMFLHASQNFYLQNLFAPLTTNTGITSWIAGEFGIGLTVVATVVALIFWSRRNELPPMQLKTEATTSS